MFIEEFTDFYMKTPDCHPGISAYVAHFQLGKDVSEIFPYINAEAEKPVYYDDPHSIQFTLDGFFRCALYPDHLKVVAFENRDQALTFFERFLDFINDLHARKGDIEPVHTIYKPVPVFPIFKLLSGTNCKACGFPTCMAFAASMSRGESTLDLCPEIRDGEGDKALKLRSMFALEAILE